MRIRVIDTGREPGHLRYEVQEKMSYWWWKGLDSWIILGAYNTEQEAIDYAKSLLREHISKHDPDNVVWDSNTDFTV